MWIDLTFNLDEHFPVWPQENSCNIITQTRGDCASSTISFNVHTSTHLDAPRHFIPGGSTINEIPLSQLIGTTQVIEIDDPISIKPKHLNRVKCTKIIFKTPNQITEEFTPDYCYLSPEAAKSLVNSNVELVGIDYLSIENFYDSDFPVHKILLRSGAVILESINTEQLVDGLYEIIALPLRINAEASPARVIAREIS